ncbi:MAG: hypothetical protein ACRER7_01650 [Gammaproteobacteria bacterium]
MYLKFAVVTLGVLGIALVGRAAFGPPHLASRVAVDSIRLVPAALGPSAQLRRWRNPQPGRGNLVEAGAVYAAGVFGPAPVMLDFFRGSDAPHNGIACFLIQGETLTEEKLVPLRTLSGTAVFDVGIVRTPGQLRLVAATECSASVCNSTRLPFLSRFWTQWNWKSLLNGPVNGVVPAAVILTQQTRAGSEQTSVAELRGELARAVAKMDFTPAERLAAAQAR